MKNTNDQLQQVVLPLSRSPERQPLLSVGEIDGLVEKVGRNTKKGWEAVYRRAIADSGLFESEVADYLRVDKGNLSKMISSGGLQQYRIRMFCDAVGNDIVIQVAAQLGGNELSPMQSTLEKQLAQERTEKAELETKLEYFKDFMRLAKVG